MDLRVLKVTDTSVKLHWLEPRAPNGILEGYQVILHDITANANDTRKLSDPHAVMEHTIGELTPFTWYKAFIQAYSRKFLGELSQPVKFRTDVSAPLPVRNVSLTCISPDAILILWERPAKFYNSLDFYYVQYKAESAWTGEEATLAARKDKSQSELLITNLTTGLLYEFTVLAGTRSILDQNLVYKSEPSATLRAVLQTNCESK